ncbi:MAG TPA: type II CAAX endopeptidase family protein [Bacillota bacterium]|nr:type II CAAX endopeptidase family protein [Bacillota bacterium]
MKKYLKMLGFLLVYYGLPVGISFGIMVSPLLSRFPRTLMGLCPSGYYGVLDPIIILALFLFFRFCRKKSLTQFSSFTKTSPSTLILGGLIGLFMALVPYSVVNMDYFKTHFESLTGTLKYFIIGGNIYLLIYTVIVNSFSKEIQFRGLMFNEMRAVLPVSVAIIAQALLYGSQVKTGCDWSVTIYAMIGQIIFGLVFYFGKSIWPSILTQICCTLGMVLFDRTILTKLFTPQSSIYIFFSGVILVVILLIVMYQRGKQPGTTAAKLEG